MKNQDAESMHRLAKMALDTGEVSSPEEAVELFKNYRLRIHLGIGWANTLAGQACFLTALNTAARAFLGGVEVFGDLKPMMQVPLFEARSADTIIEELGGEIATNPISNLPTLVIGSVPVEYSSHFAIRLSWDAWCASVTPLADENCLSCKVDNPLAGVAAAALGVNEAFLHIRGDLLDAGHRVVGISLWNPLAANDWNNDENRGPALQYLPASLWLIGLGHLGQAYVWALGMLPYPENDRPHLVLQDYDKAAESNLSTCLLLKADDLGESKVRLVAKRIESAGFTTNLIERHFGSNHQVMDGEPTTALIGVDNINARRDLDSSSFTMIVEAGLGSGYLDFRDISFHTFPGSRKPTEIWTAEMTVQKEKILNDTYSQLAKDRNDQCGITKLASRAVATPFVGALAATLVLSEVIRPLHGGGIHESMDIRMKNLLHSAGSESKTYSTLAPYVIAVSPHPLKIPQ